MSEYKKLKEKFDKDVKELKESCLHEVLTEPFEVFWAYGHSCGYKSKFCERCGKQMYRPDPPKLEHEPFDEMRDMLKE
jgi:hypothetical protein